MGGEFPRRGPIRWQMPPRLASFAVFGALILLLLLSPQHASAGTYDVYSCRLPDGSPASTAGWTSHLLGARVKTNDTCAEGGSLSAWFFHGFPVGIINVGDFADWRFDAPSDV